MLRRDDGRPESRSSRHGFGLTAAVLTELTFHERITLSEGKDPQVIVLSAAQVGQPVLDAVQIRLGEFAKSGELEKTKLSQLITDGKIDPERMVIEGLAQAGVIRIEPEQAGGWISARYPIVDPTPEAQTRERLRIALAGGTPSRGDACLLAILQGLRLAPRLLAVEKGTLSKRQLKQRIGEVADESVIGRTAARTARAINDAIITVLFSRMLAQGDTFRPASQGE